jgi:hypothetical protein
VFFGYVHDRFVSLIRFMFVEIGSEFLALQRWA